MEYMNHIEKKEYEVMYTMIDSDEKVYLTKEEYIQRNSKIYEGIEVSDIKISHIAVKEKKQIQLRFRMKHHVIQLPEQYNLTIWRN